MAKISLPEYMREGRRKECPTRPFLTISRQYGCYGYTLGLLVLEIVNENAPPQHIWRIYNKEILQRLARETSMATDLLERERHAKPGLLVDFFRAFSEKRIPSGYEIRNRITMIIRGLAMRGHAVILGQGGAGATQDLPHGLSIRLEAPEEWRIRQIAFRDQIGMDEAGKRIRQIEKERSYLREIYEKRFPRKPAWNLTYDCSVFSLAQIAQQVVQAMRMKDMV